MLDKVYELAEIKNPTSFHVGKTDKDKAFYAFNVRTKIAVPTLVIPFEIMPLILSSPS